MKKLTNLELLKKVNEETARLEHDENAWLKHLAEMGELARKLMDMKFEIVELQAKVKRLEGGTK